MVRELKDDIGYGSSKERERERDFEMFEIDARIHEREIFSGCLFLL